MLDGVGMGELWFAYCCMLSSWCDDHKIEWRVGIARIAERQGDISHGMMSTNGTCTTAAKTKDLFLDLS